MLISKLRMRNLLSVPKGTLIVEHTSRNPFTGQMAAMAEPAKLGRNYLGQILINGEECPKMVSATICAKVFK